MGDRLPGNILVKYKYWQMRCARRAGILFRKITSVQKKGAEWICVGRKEAKGKKEEGESHKKTNLCGVCLPVYVDGVGAVHGVCRGYGFRRRAV